MTPDYQTLFNLALGVAAFFGGWVLKTVSQNVRDLQSADTKLADKVNQLQVLVVGDYVHRAEFDRKIDAVFAALRRIEDKLDEKADKG